MTEGESAERWYCEAIDRLGQTRRVHEILLVGNPAADIVQFASRGEPYPRGTEIPGVPPVSEFVPVSAYP